jgi:histidinol-phosphate aminotransferase
MVKERSGVEKIAPYQAAKSLELIKREYGLTQIIKLAGNENRLGCSLKVGDILTDQQNQLSFYPDSNCTVLRGKLSEVLSVEPEQLVFGNGSFELIALIAHAYLEAGEESVIPDPSFGWYRNVTLQMNAIPVMVPLKDYAIDLNAIYGQINDKTKVIWLCNPNNPTGTILEQEPLTEFIEKVPESILIVLDEAYIDFVEGTYFNTIDFVRHHENVILLRTFSKLYGLASFRIGYGIGAVSILERINKVRSPLNVSFAAQQAASVSLEDEGFKQKVLDNNRKSLDLYYSELDGLGLNYVRSHGNFILIHVGIDGAVAESIFLRNGIVIRNASEFGLDGFIRVSVGTYEENEKVIAVLRKIIQEPHKQEE